MKVSATLVASLAAFASAFPGMSAMKGEIEEVMKRKAVSGPDEALESDIEGLLGSVAQGTLDLSNRRPEPGYDFRAPGPNDSRGPCPGLNTLANHGYLPRNGYVNAGQILEATSRGFNMGQDLATVLIVFAVLSDGDLDTQAWWLGTDPKTKVGGLNRHSTVESDISPNREDYYNGCGDNHHLSSRMFRRNVRFASQDPNKEFSIPVMAKHFSAQADFAKKYNPTLYYFPFPMIVSVVAYNFYPRFFSNGTSELGGVANYESISSIVGAKYQKKTGQFEYVPERFPDNWYRRSFPYGAVEALTEGFTMVYPANPVFPPGFLEPNSRLNTTAIFCDMYQGLNSITPLVLAGQEEKTAKKISWALSLLDKNLKGSVLGCNHDTTLSKNFFPKPHQKGGPLNPPKSVLKNVGNNVYNKVYFPTAPTSPQCDHVM